jgi:hypothetical protein
MCVVWGEKGTGSRRRKFYSGAAGGSTLRRQTPSKDGGDADGLTATLDQKTKAKASSQTNQNMDNAAAEPDLAAVDGHDDDDNYDHDDASAAAADPPPLLAAPSPPSPPRPPALVPPAPEAAADATDVTGPAPAPANAIAAAQSHLALEHEHARANALARQLEAASAEQELVRDEDRRRLVREAPSARRAAQ